jgi:hypothetical protein
LIRTPAPFTIDSRDPRARTSEHRPGRLKSASE